jgi:hypothetical protein
MRMTSKIKIDEIIQKYFVSNFNSFILIKNFILHLKFQFKVIESA